MTVCISCLSIGADHLLEVAADVLQHIGVGAASGAFGQAGHQIAEVRLGEFIEVGAFAHAAQQVTQAFVMGGTVGHQQVFVARVKGQQAVTGQPFGQQLLPTGVDENAGQEVFPQHRVVKSAVFFDR